MPEQTADTVDASPGQVVIQVRPAHIDGVTPQNAGDLLRKLSPNQIAQIAETVRNLEQGLFTKLRSLPSAPTSVGLEFGIDAEGEAGIPFVTKGSIGANFKVTMEWKKQTAE